MPVCRFFLQNGTCRFGDNCRFSHDISGEANDSFQPRNYRPRNDRTNSYEETRPRNDVEHNRGNYQRSNNRPHNSHNSSNTRSGPSFSFTNARTPLTSTNQADRFTNFSFINPVQPKKTIFHTGKFNLKVPTLEVEEVEVVVDLTPSEIEQFEKREFDIGQIPLNPPPPKFCR